MEQVKTGLTPRQLEVYKVIARLIEANGYSPTYPALAEELGMKPNRVHYHVEALQTRGWVRKLKWHKRTLQLVD